MRVVGDCGSDGCGEPILCLGNRGTRGELGEGRSGGVLLGGSKVDEGLLGRCRLLRVTTLGVPLDEGDEQEYGRGERGGYEVAVPAGGRGQQRPSGLTQSVGGSMVGSDGGAVGAVEGDGCRLNFCPELARRRDCGVVQQLGECRSLSLHFGVGLIDCRSLGGPGDEHIGGAQLPIGLPPGGACVRAACVQRRGLPCSLAIGQAEALTEPV
ncbi:hypothetical protein [Streptomyces halstedii]|uniref:hypothetical protein n=1 Tax=Streptomyces halstedii TaxID=1944 RepID=UPI0036B3D8FC